MSVYRFTASGGWQGGVEPKNNLSRFSTDVDYHTRPSYDFIDRNITGKPIRIHGKRQWRETLKRYSMNDDVHWTDGKNSKRKPRSVEEFPKKVEEAVERAIKEVSKRPYCDWNKRWTEAEIRTDVQRERNRLYNMRRSH